MTTTDKTNDALPLTQEESEATERIRPLLLALGRAIMDGTDATKQREAVEACGAILSAHDDPSDICAFASPDEVMIVAHYGRCRLPILVRTDNPGFWAAQFTKYKEPKLYA